MHINIIMTGGGVPIRGYEVTDAKLNGGTSDLILDMIHNIIPDNIIRVTLQTVRFPISQ